MRFITFLSALALCSTAVSATDNPPSHGVYLGDMDKSVSPCVDFFDYANGAWRQQNPIPATMVRWSRRWESGETNKDVLHGILEETTTQSANAKPGSIDQLVGDYYGACMDEKNVEELGIQPIASDLASIRSI